MLIKIFFAILLLISLIYNLYQFRKILKVKEQLRNMEIVLSDIQDGNGNRRILSASGDLTSTLSYKINDIICKYEEEIARLKLAKKANKELMTSLSHDVRTPLTTLIGYLDAIDKDIVKDFEKEKYFQIARLKAYDLKDYIDILFEWFKLQSSELDIVIERVEITELTRLILRDWIPIIEDYKIKFEIKMPDKPIFINLDQEKYTRIINNLLQNLIDHSRATEFKISILKENSKLYISIEDNGIGIDQDELPYIFDRLYKSDKGRSKKGSGLGLAIVKQMVEKMKGKIDVVSKKAEYTKFTIEFPIE